MNMEYSQRTTPVSRSWIVAVLVIVILSLSAVSVSAETYRWKDKEGKVHYGVTIPAEYAEQPYDILNSAGIVIEHVEDTSIPQDIIEEKKILARQPLISEEQRRIQSDKLLVIQYESEEDIINALELELAQLGYDSRLINQAYESISTSLRNQIRQAADQQRAGQEISADQQKEIASLYKRQARDERRQSEIQHREEDIRARFQQDLDRYRFLTSENSKTDEEKTDQG
ncbi:MAG: DUF4124 domain-containing protein [Gammaproteobacteria bacterium]|nr:DUF4124 domain-containing protein [Gammaproteobacteria bacterium]